MSLCFFTETRHLYYDEENASSDRKPDIPMIFSFNCSEPIVISDDEDTIVSNNTRNATGNTNTGSNQTRGGGINESRLTMSNRNHDESRVAEEANVIRSEVNETAITNVRSSGENILQNLETNLANNNRLTNEARRIAENNTSTNGAEENILANQGNQVQVTTERTEPTVTTNLQVNQNSVPNSNGNGAPMEIHKKADKSYYKCPICCCYYKSLKAYAIHMFENHKKVIKNPEPVAFETNCQFCLKPFNVRSYNQHIKSSHRDMFENVKMTKLSFGYRCLLCEEKFPNYRKAKWHRLSHEGIDKRKVIITKNSLDTSNPSNETPILKKDTTGQSMKNTKLWLKVVPKSILFKCGKCPVQFLSCKKAWAHKLHCNQNEENTKLTVVACAFPAGPCGRVFDIRDIRAHYEQHKHLTTDFSSIEVQENTDSKLLYRCQRCQICYNEKLFSLHCKIGCDKRSKSNCTICNQNISPQYFDEHITCHNLGYTFTIVDVLYSPSNTKLNRTRESVISA